MYFLLFLPTFTHLFTTLSQQKNALLSTKTKVRILNDVCLWQMMKAKANDDADANDVCLRAHKGKHRIIATAGRNIIFAKQMHHIAAGDTSFDILTVLCYNKVKKCLCFI